MNQEQPRPTNLSDNTRRTICRIAFLLLCVLPTSTLIYFLLHPFTAADWQQLIRSELAIETTIDSVENVGPYETVLRGLEFSDPEYGPLLVATEVRVRTGKTNHILIEHPVQISTRGLAHVIRRLDEHLVRTHRVAKPWQIHFGKTTIVRDSSSGEPIPQSLIANQLVVELIPHQGEGTEARLSLQLAGPIASEISWVQGFLHRHIDPQSVEMFGLNSGTHFLPCWLLADIAPDLRHFGDRSEFQGRFHIEPDRHSSQVNGELVGVFRNLALEELSAGLPHPVSGNCIARVEQCLIRDGRLQTLEGHAFSERGTIAQRWLEAAQEHLGIRTLRNLVGNRVPFSSLEFQFRVHEGRLQIGSTTGILANDETEQPLLRATTTSAHSLDDFVHGVVRPDGDPQLYDEELAILSRFAFPKSVQVADGNDEQYR